MKTLGMILLTFRELWAKKITLGLFIVATLAWVMLSFALNLDVVEGSIAGLRIFGQDAEIQEGFSLDRLVIGVQQFVAGAAYLLGTLLGLFATAPLVIGLLERGRIDLMLSKPMSRVGILAGHVVGVWLAVVVLTIYLIGAVWLVMSLKTGIWNPRFLLAIPVIVLMFGVMYSVIICLGVGTQSTALSLVIAYGLIFTSAILAGHEQIIPQIIPPWRQVFIGFYHVLPNFIEVTQIVSQLSGSEVVATWYPFYSSLLFGGAVYGAAILWFIRKDF